MYSSTRDKVRSNTPAHDRGETNNRRVQLALRLVRGGAISSTLKLSDTRVVLAGLPPRRLQGSAEGQKFRVVSVITRSPCGPAVALWLSAPIGHVKRSSRGGDVGGTEYRPRIALVARREETTRDTFGTSHLPAGRIAKRRFRSTLDAFLVAEMHGRVPGNRPTYGAAHSPLPVHSGQSTIHVFRLAVGLEARTAVFTALVKPHRRAIPTAIWSSSSYDSPCRIQACSTSRSVLSTQSLAAGIMRDSGTPEDVARHPTTSTASSIARIALNTRALEEGFSSAPASSACPHRPA